MPISAYWAVNQDVFLLFSRRFNTPGYSYPFFADLTLWPNFIAQPLVDWEQYVLEFLILLANLSVTMVSLSLTLRSFLGYGFDLIIFGC
jgi:hypothetical protein